MKKIIIYFLAMIFFFAFITSCDPNFNRMPTNYPNTRWVSQEPDMFFEIKSPRANFYTASYAQIIIDGEVVELRVVFAQSQMFVDDPAGYDPDTGQLLSGLNTSDVHLFTGTGRFNPDRVVIRITHNPRGFLDDSIEQIIFYREDIE